tara:strand:+ start:2346 stop:2687 length:342 start_codon:yes stop_codon:yes gene_type:complete
MKIIESDVKAKAFLPPKIIIIVTREPTIRPKFAARLLEEKIAIQLVMNTIIADLEPRPFHNNRHPGSVKTAIMVTVGFERERVMSKKFEILNFGLSLMASSNTNNRQGKIPIR